MPKLEKRIRVIEAMRRAGRNPVIKIRPRKTYERIPQERVPRPKDIEAKVSTTRSYRPIAERIALIRQDAEEGVPSVELIAQIEGVSETYVRQTASLAGINLPAKRRSRQTEIYTEERISVEQELATFRQAIVQLKEKEERVSAYAISRLIGFPVSRVYYLAQKEGTPLLHKGYHGEFSPQQKVAIINDAIAKGEKSLEALCRVSGTQPRQFWKLVDMYIIQLPDDFIPYRYVPEMDAIIDRGGMLQEIGIAGGYSQKSARENARQYLILSGQHKIWKAKRESPKIEAQQKKQIVGDLVNILQARINQLIPTLSWPEQMAVAYHSRKYVKLPYQRLYLLFQRRKEAEDRGERLSLRKLEKISGISASEVGRILRKMEVVPKHQQLRYSQEEKEKARKIYRLGMNFRDTEFFTGIPDNTMKIYMRERGFKFRSKQHVKWFGSLGALTYRLASQIYESQSAGIRRVGDIAELLDTIPKIIRYAIEHKHRIAPKIVQALRIAYDNPDYSKPYKK